MFLEAARGADWYRCGMAEAHASESHLRILIVEDNRDARTVMRMLLSRGHGHTVYEAGDGDSGVRSAIELKPDVALIDIGLPDLDGHAVARRIRDALGSDGIVLVALTGYGSPEDQQLARESGFDVHLVKPVDSQALARVLDGVRRA